MWDPLTSAKTMWWREIQWDRIELDCPGMVCVYDGPDYLLLFWRT